MENSPFDKSSFLEAFDRKAGDLLETSLAEEDSVMDIRHEVLVFRILVHKQFQLQLKQGKTNTTRFVLGFVSTRRIRALLEHTRSVDPEFAQELQFPTRNVVEITKILGELSSSCDACLVFPAGCTKQQYLPTVCANFINLVA